MNFKKERRSYKTPRGYRLATYEEARNGLETIKEKRLLEEWDRARLLDGWISGPGSDFQMGKDFRGCMAFMLVIAVEHEQASISSGTMYKDINLSKDQKEVALLLCTEDWNSEVVYWVLNSLSGRETMDPGDDTQGNIPFSYPAKFEEMNTMMYDVVRKFVEEGPASEKAAKRKFPDLNSVPEVLSGMINIAKEQQQRTKELFSFSNTWDYLSVLTRVLNDLSDVSLENNWLGDVASQGGETWEAIADAVWNFLSESFASLMVSYFAIAVIVEICRFTNQWDPKEITRAEENFIFASYVLFYISLARREIIHAPLAGYSEDSSSIKILCFTTEMAEQQPESLNKMLQHNALWRCYEEDGNYKVLDKLLVLASKGQALLQKGKKIDILVINSLLECGAKPGISLRSCKNKTALHYATKLKDEKVVKCLLEKCDNNQLKNFINAKDDRGRTALHRATELGYIPVCKLLLENGAQLDDQDKCGHTVLHNVVELGKEEVIDLFVEDPNINTCFQLKNDDNNTPLDVALAKKNIEMLAPLLWKLDEPEAYFSEVDLRQLLRQTLLKGYVKIVKLLLDKGEGLPGGDVDDHGKTTLHLATMCENEEKAKEMVALILKGDEDKENLVAKCDRRGRTVLHEAALKGHTSLCKDLLDKNPNLIDVQDKNGRNALYDAVQGKHDNIDAWKALYGAYRKRGGKLEDVIDRSGLTPLHVAAEEGRKNFVEDLLSNRQVWRKHMDRADFLGQTALHKAAKLGDKETVDILLKNGANPFQERDCDGRTALHYAVQAKTGKEGEELAKLLLERCKSQEERLLLLWASAAGVGPADQNLTDPVLKVFLSDKKKLLLKEMKSDNLLRIAAYIGHTGMTKELLSRGFQIGDIQNDDWQQNLCQKQKENVKKVTRQLERFAQQGNDLPTIKDYLERSDYAHGLAALLLNPFIKPPIATESVLLKTVAQFALLPSSHLPRSTSDLPGVKVLQLSKEGVKRCEEIKRQLNMPFFAASTKGDDEDPLGKFLSNYEPKYRDIFKSLAVMDSTNMFTSQEQHSTKAVEQSVPAIITVQYNAWKYRNETEALAGMAVEITTEIEGSMTDPQWITTCFRNTWRKQKYSMWIEIIFPVLLATLLACSFTWIVWLVFDRYKVKELAKAKYACIPAVIVVVVWILAKSVMGALKPVSTQLMNYISFPDHKDKLGYQERVISDIIFLKDEIGRKPSKICTAMVKLWNLVIKLKLWFARMLCSSPKCLGTNLKFPPAPSSNIRIVVFVDDLDRCQELVILQVLAAINLVLAVCEINVVLGMDKRLLERAITKKYGDSKAKSSKANKELADNYLQKVIQLPLDLPDPSEKQVRRFLKRHMGVVRKESDDNDTELRNAHNTKIKKGQMSKLLSLKTSEPDGKRPTEPNKNDTNTHGTDGEAPPGLHAPPTSSVAIDVVTPRGAREMSFTGTEGSTNFTRRNSPPNPANTSDGRYTSKTGNERPNPLIPIPIREMLFVTYSLGEWDAICHFQKQATDCRKLPREWKRFLNYHRLVWNIFSINIVEKPLVGWQVQLISWIFICWEWKENMDILINDWLNVAVLKSLKSEKPSLGIIVDHFIEECGSKNQNRRGNPEEKDGVANADESNFDTNMTESTQQGDTTQTAEGPQEIESRLEKIEVELKEMKKSLEELKMTINELKLGQATKNVAPKNENSVDGNKIKQENMPNWRRLRSALNKYDVSMGGIQAFQRFRFYCVPGHLQWPLPKQEWEA